MKERNLESIIVIQTIIILVLLCIVVWFINDRTYINQMRYDLNRDGVVDIKDVLNIQKYVIENE